MRSFLARRVLLEHLPEWVARGWRPAVTDSSGAVGVTPVCDGFYLEVLIVRDDKAIPDASFLGGDLVALWSGPFGDAYTERNDPANTGKPPRRDIVREVATTLAPTPLRLCEIGANIGLNVRGVAGIVPRIVAVDVNRGALEQLRAQNPWIQTVHTPAQVLPFLDREFDLTVCIGVLIHIPPEDLGEVMDELVRVTAVGGHILTGNYDAPEETVVPYHQDAGSEALCPRLWRRPYHALFREGRPVEPVWSKHLGEDEGWDRVSMDLWRRT